MPTSADARRRGIEVGFLAERYHRAFHEEVAAITSLVERVASPELVIAFRDLREQLAHHEQLQEGRLFSAYESCGTCERTLFEAWMKDSAALAEHGQAVRLACSVGVTSPGLRYRVLHFVAEVEHHLVDEIELLALWAGTSGKGIC